MGNCTASRLVGGGEEEEAVELCKERKKLIKLAVERRYALAEAHVKYTHALCSVAAAINLFVTRHTTPTPILITLPPSSPPSSSSAPSFLKQTPSEPKTEAVMYRSSSCSSSSCSSPSSSSSTPVLVEEENGGGGDQEGAGVGEVAGHGHMGYGGYFFSGGGGGVGAPPPPPSPMRAFGWDFFNPFDGVRGVEHSVAMDGLGRSSDEELRAVREEEGIPELEEEEEARVGSSGGDQGEGNAALVGGGSCDDGSGCEVVKMVVEEGGSDENGCVREKGLTVIDTPARERELLDALRDVEDHFIRAYDSGKEVSRMLEANQRAPFPSSFEEVKENSSKLIPALTWHRSTSTQSSSYRSFLASSSRSTSFAETRSDIFDDYGGMESGSHSQTLGRLYAWEKKLYEEVKAGEKTRKIYERKCSQMRNHDVKGILPQSVDKTRVAAREMYTRIWVIIKSAETISKRIQKLKDDELQPQLIELLHGLMKTWQIMLESHETQNQIMFEVKSFTCPAYGKFCSDSHRFATLQLDTELQNWKASFQNYIAAQKAYVEALDGWLSKFLAPEVEFYSRGRSSAPPYGFGSSPLLVISRYWQDSLRRLPDRAVSLSLKSFSKDVKILWEKQGEEQQQKRKVDNLAKELDRRILTFQKAESRVVESKFCDHSSEPDVRQRVEYLAGRKDMLDMFKEKLEVEKAKHHDCMRETQRVALNCFKKGFTNVSDSLVEFSRNSVKMYDHVLIHYQKSAQMHGSSEKPSCIEGTQPEVENSDLPIKEDHSS